MDQIMVSVSCLVYNHEKYLRKCLDSLVNQKTSFKYEVLVHDDASTDGSAEIIREYEHKYPEIIKPIYQIENQYSKQVKISPVFQYPRAKGKYVAWCEGDDFWTDENKLQKQFDALENNPYCGICVHKVSCVNEDGSSADRIYPNYSFCDGIIDGYKILELFPNWIFHLSSFFIKKDLLFELHSDNKLSDSAPAGDTLIQYFCAMNTDYYYIDTTMSSYRLFSNNSWTLTMSSNEERFIQINKRFQNFTKELMNYYKKDFFDEIAKQAIDQYETQILLKQKNYKKVFSLRKSNYYQSLNKKLKVIIFASKFIPGFEMIYKKHLLKTGE